MGNRVLADLIGGLAGGALIGWLLDRWLGTSPWLLLALMFLGIAAAFRNIIRISSKRPDRISGVWTINGVQERGGRSRQDRSDAPVRGAVHLRRLRAGRAADRQIGRAHV